MDPYKEKAVYMLIFLIGLKGISREYYEAAAIDGATTAKAFWHITLPIMKSITVFVILASDCVRADSYSNGFGKGKDGFKQGDEIMDRKLGVVGTIKVILLMIGAAVMLGPFFWMFTTAFKTQPE